MPRTASIRKIRTSGSRHTLIHIRQIHRRPDREMTPEIWGLVRSCQDDIQEILTFFMDHPTIALRRVYDEGLDPIAHAAETISQDIERMQQALEATHPREMLLEEEPIHRRLLELEESELQRLRDTDLLIGETEDQRHRHIAALEKSITERKAALEKLATVREEITRERQGKQEEESQRRYRRSATEELARTRGLQRLVAEDVIRSLRADLLAEKAVSGEHVDARTYDRNVFTNRELTLLQIIARRGDTAAVTVYGAAHNWEGEIAQWNASHPDQTFSLIEVTPHTVAHHRDVLTELLRRGRE